MLQGPPGLLDLVPGSRQDLVLGIGDALDRADAALAAIPEPLAVAVDAHAGSIVTAMEALQALQILLQADLTEVLGVTVQFNDNDGD